MPELVEYDALADIYDVWVESAAALTARHPPFYGKRYIATEGPVVELGVGNGRIMITAAQKGKDVTGVDSSPAMIELCRRRAEEAGVLNRLTLLRADFRDFLLPEPAALIAMPFHTIGHLLSVEDKRAGLSHIRSQLRPGGSFVFDHFVFDPGQAARHTAPQLRAEFTHSRSGRDAILWVSARHDRKSQRMRIVARTDELDPMGVVVRSRYNRVDFSWLEPDQARALLTETGFEVEAVYGDYDETPFDHSSQEQIWVARNPG
ncbi:MAG: class I SAM-dependent methyltransferase [Planctomycetota bacterium]